MSKSETEKYSYETLLVEKQGHVVIVTINRPDKLNALTVRMRAEGAHLLSALGSDPDVRVIVLTGAGDKAFIAGADISEFAGKTPVAQREVMLGQSLFSAIDTCPKPVIAMIHGYCLGGGMEIALACDLRIAADNARIGQPEINLGLIPGGGGTQRLTRLVGEGKSMELILTGDIVDAQTGLEIGFLNHLFPLAELREETLKIANRIAEKSPIALRMAKEAIKGASRSNLDEGLRREIDLFALCFASEDKEEGVNAFLEKRKPVFKGR
ncbi:MAG: enoyl-CoA hydratase/isomerase family protein [Pyrinomonadaceae bacterium]